MNAAELQPKTLESWDLYERLTQRRVAVELDDGKRFLVLDFGKIGQSDAVRAALRRGEIHIQKMLTPSENGQPIQVDGGMIHHWIGAIFVPGVRLDQLRTWLQDYDHHAGRFPEVEQSRLVARDGDTFQIFFRLRRKKIITVYYNTWHTAVYRSHDGRHASSHSFTTKIAELQDVGTPQESERPAGDDRGFLWRLNSYWRYEEADNGVYVECESISLSRAIPFGLGWLIRGYVESVPRESLENTLGSIRNGIGGAGTAAQAGGGRN